MPMRDIFQLCDVVRQAGYELNRYLGNGHLEKVYEKGLMHRLRKAGIKALPQQPLNVFDEDGTLLGEYFVDLLVEDILVVEIKACSKFANKHVAQLIGYLQASRIEHGLLINSGGGTYQIRKLVCSRDGKKSDQSIASFE